MFDQRVCNAHMTFLGHQVQRRQAILQHREREREREIVSLAPSTAGSSSFSSSPHLVAHVDIGLFGDQQGSDVGPALLGSQVQRRDALQRLGIGRGAALQQATRHLQLVLLGGDVQGGVAILWIKGGGGVKQAQLKPSLLQPGCEACRCSLNISTRSVQSEFDVSRC